MNKAEKIKQSEKLKEVEIKTPNDFEKRKLKILGFQVKQGENAKFRH